MVAQLTIGRWRDDMRRNMRALHNYLIEEFGAVNRKLDALSTTLNADPNTPLSLIHISEPTRPY